MRLDFNLDWKRTTIEGKTYKYRLPKGNKKFQIKVWKPSDENHVGSWVDVPKSQQFFILYKIISKKFERSGL